MLSEPNLENWRPRGSLIFGALLGEVGGCMKKH